jgi:pyridoxamine 5'-phosphate oxidase
VRCPEDFVGYRLVADAVEFWQGDSGRMHDRVTHLREVGGWRTIALQP